MRPVPHELRHRPFSRAEALASGVTSRMLEGRRFVNVYAGVWRCADHPMTRDDWLVAARLALAPRAHLTGITRLQALGLDHGPRLPLRFVVQGDLHRPMPYVFLHRTKKLAPHDEHGIRPAGAFIAYCARARVIDAIVVGDWLLHHDHMTLRELCDLAYAERWRDGALEALWVSEYLSPDSRSLKESESRAVLEFAGLPRPRVNVAVPLDGTVVAIGDLVYPEGVVEYEGRQHQEDPVQYASDIARYAAYRRCGVSYVQVTNDLLARPAKLVLQVHEMLASNGYCGPAPEFGERWRSLFRPLSQTLGASKRDFLLRLARGEVS